MLSYSTIGLSIGILCALSGIQGCSSSPEELAEPQTHESQQSLGALASLNDYWAGQATWQMVDFWSRTELESNAQHPPGVRSDPAGTHIEIVNGIWYLFSRKLTVSNGVASMGIEVRRSTNGGANWSAPVDAIVPTAGTPYSRYATDGDAYYDPVTNRWHYLFQCLGDSGVWNGCYATRQGADPMGPFTPSAANPVIRSRSLWQRICNQSTDDCSRIPGGTNRVFDEGTFDIFRYDGQFYWVDFHGYDGVRGYRGIAKTRDFVNWIAGDPSQGVPTDAVIDRDDAVGWRETWDAKGPIGGGAGSVLADGGYHYMVAELADGNLGGALNQKWDLGIFRTSSLTNTRWEQLPARNPILYSTWPAPAWSNGVPFLTLQYARLFKDPANGAIYLHVTREHPNAQRNNFDPNLSGIYLYRLERTTNVLKNSDLWMGDSSHWQRINSPNLAVYREYYLSSDGNQFMAMNCGVNPCRPGQSVYQDVSAASYRGRPFNFGGKFKAVGGAAGDLVMAVHQLDSLGRIVRTNSVPVRAGTNYTNFNGSGVVEPTAQTLRFEMYLNTATVTYWADEMYLKI